MRTIAKILVFIVALLYSLGTPAMVYAEANNDNRINYTITEEGSFIL